MNLLVSTSPRTTLIARAGWLFGWLLLLMSGEALAQVPGEELGVQGTAAYNAIWNGTTRPSDGFVLAWWRFSGRVAVRVAHGMYIGGSVGSWQTSAISAAGSTFPGLVTGLSTAVLGSAYGQAYPLHHAGVFVRGGVGYAATTTYYPGGAFISDDSHIRATVSGGLGLDMAIKGHLALTPSLDYTHLIGADGEREVKRGLLVGLGLTVR